MSSADRSCRRGWQHCLGRMDEEPGLRNGRPLLTLASAALLTLLWLGIENRVILGIGAV